MNLITKHFEPHLDAIHKKLKYTYHFSKLAKSAEKESEEMISEVLNKILEEDGNSMTKMKKQSFIKEIKGLLLKTIEEKDKEREENKKSNSLYLIKKK